MILFCDELDRIEYIRLDPDALKHAKHDLWQRHSFKMESSSPKRQPSEALKCLSKVLYPNYCLLQSPMQRGVTRFDQILISAHRNILGLSIT
ncbi:uncharacterized protein MYCFIDRAFT_170376 [Pseudocercospora fijiensis CIRAD86]|uniref:Uncharacterized protein n=1 Tax=Pseudocercospora fijiensis (strain CIRAD86) TaxID=383855 RepID=N1Q7S5_PSEFD|nr:uncharacterized protein MYCFIDRAFT_170376 [Pseudocercospora fijiensis CIRAD86]EME88800.1 hypothetical protein MYCFIDRAFT_170376 [Pseudocercospora fijiensis CIRAD86]